MDCSPPGSSVHGILQARILKWVAIPSSKGSSQSRDWTQVSLITSGFLPSEPLGKPRNTGVGSLSLLQCIFLTQGWNPGLPHCRRILSHPSHQGSTTLAEVAVISGCYWIQTQVNLLQTVLLFPPTKKWARPSNGRLPARSLVSSLPAFWLLPAGT